MGYMYLQGLHYDIVVETLFPAVPVTALLSLPGSLCPGRIGLAGTATGLAQADLRHRYPQRFVSR
eukprot:SAG31_NODE_22012_length_535_cov_6.243119_2_plen_64_part_01